MTTLVWDIRSSLLAYVEKLARGTVELTGGAVRTEEGIAFPSAGNPDYPLAFRGTLTMSGHGGMLKIVVADPVVHREEDGRWLLSVVDADGDRVVIAVIEFLGEDETGRVHGGPTTLHPQGVAIFGGQYEAGSELDSPMIIL